MLYPMKFDPLLKHRIWGGRGLEHLGKKLPEGEAIGESWEISGLRGEASVLANGPLAGQDLAELILRHPLEMVGRRCLEAYGTEFPVLIKLIDAQDDLSIQVHPTDDLAMKRHQSRGKTEMWYVVDHEPGASLLVGFKAPTDRQTYLQALNEDRLDSLLRRYEVHRGDVFFIPAGTVHAIGRGILVAEIQQTSDITYRVYDYGRRDRDGKMRALHTELALEAIDFKGTQEETLRRQAPEDNVPVELVRCPYFVTSILKVSGSLLRRQRPLETYATYVCLEGSARILWGKGQEETIARGESLLIPAQMEEWTLQGSATLLETGNP